MRERVIGWRRPTGASARRDRHSAPLHFDPVGTGAEVYFEGDVEGHGVFHFVADEGGPLFGGFFGGSEDEFVVDLDEHFDFVIRGDGGTT